MLVEGKLACNPCLLRKSSVRSIICNSRELSHSHPESHAGEAASRLAKGIPIGRSPTVDVRNSHVSYIVTW